MLVTRPTQIFRSFLTNSAAHGTSDKNQQQFVWLLGGSGLAAFLFTLITSKSAATAATAMTSLFCLAAPLAGTLMSAVPARMMQQRAYKVGAVIPAGGTSVSWAASMLCRPRRASSSQRVRHAAGHPSRQDGAH